MLYVQGVHVLVFEKFKHGEWWLRKRHIPTVTTDKQCFSLGCFICTLYVAAFLVGHSLA
jgi:hypothetical protein